MVHHLLGNDTSSNFLSSQESLRSRSASASKSPSQKAPSSSVLGCGEGKIATATAAATSSVPRWSPSREVEGTRVLPFLLWNFCFIRSRRGRTRGTGGPPFLLSEIVENFFYISCLQKISQLAKLLAQVEEKWTPQTFFLWPLLPTLITKLIQDLFLLQSKASNTIQYHYWPD